MNLLRLIFGGKQPASASTARARLRIVLEEERVGRSAPEFLSRLQHELLEVVRRYYDLDEDMVRFGLERVGETAVLNINVDLDPACEKSGPHSATRKGKGTRARPRPALGNGSAS
jgi:cell division topological specificity factor